jgi:aminodeoxyfutalosine synthase
MLDNIPHIKAYRMNIGDSVAQMALSAGADDIDGTVGHEEIMHSAGSQTRLDSRRDDICRLIEDAGYTPVKRNSTYSEFERVASLATERTVLPIIEV